MLEHKKRYLQIAFNYDLRMALQVLRVIPASPRILIEAGTPFIKREGLRGVSALRSVWKGHLVADLKTSDGAYDEVAMARNVGVTAVTALGSSPVETLDRFVAACHDLDVISMIDMLGVADPLDTLMHLKAPPQVVVLHRGRDEESSRDKVIQYRHVNRVRSKYDVIISAAGGVDLREARSAIFNGANIVVVNLVQPSDPWAGIRTDKDIRAITQEFLATIE